MAKQAIRPFFYNESRFAGATGTAAVSAAASRTEAHSFPVRHCAVTRLPFVGWWEWEYSTMNQRRFMVKRQLELSLGQAADIGKPPRRGTVHSRAQERRQSRGHWWFARMRQVVEDAVERQPSQVGCPESR